MGTLPLRRSLPSLALVLIAGLSFHFQAPLLPGQTDDKKEATKEEKVNEFLQRLADSEKEQKYQAMGAVIDDIDRVCKLSDDQKKELRLASKGAVDKYLESWRTQMDEWVRRRVTGVDGEIEEFLAGMGSVRSGNSRNWAPERQAVWRTSVKEVLTAEQRTSYQEDIQQRAAFKHRAMAHVVVADLDRRIKLAPEQREKLLALVVESSGKYWDRLENWSGDEENLPFYQMGAIMGGVPEEEIKKILSERQMEGWRQYFTRFSGVWDNLQQMEDPPGFDLND